MTGNEVFTRLKEQGVLFEVVNGQVNLKLPKGLSDEAKHMLRTHKDTLKAFLLQLNSHAQRTPAITKRAGNIPYLPLSSAQKRLYLVDHMLGGSAHYNMVSTFKVLGEFDVERFESVVKQIIGRHEILRTVYAQKNGEPYQRILAAEDVVFNVQHFDLRQLDASAQAAQVLELMKQATQYTFDLSQDLMLRATYIATGAAEGALALVMHHIASDGWSMDIFTREFFALYNQVDGTADISELPIQYADYAVWQQSKGTQSALNKQLQYWQKQLADAPVMHSLPSSLPRTLTPTHDGAAVSYTLSAQQVSQLKDIAQQHNLTVFALLHGLLALLLSRFSNSHDIVIGTPIAGRNQKELEPLFGFFVNMLALRVDTRYDQLSEYFERVRTVNVDAQANQDIAFDAIVEALGLSGTGSASPLFQILLTLDGQFSVGGEPQGPVALGGAKLEPLSLPILQTKYDLHIDCQFSRESGAIHWIYNCGLFSEADVSALSVHFGHLLATLAEHGVSAYQAPAALPLIPDAEVQQTLAPQSSQSVDLAIAKPLHYLVEQQALQNPDKVAVAWGDASLSYAELNLRAEQVAERLQTHSGIGPGACIGVYATRSADMVIAILGALKVGAAYVPLDPAYPQARIEYMIERANIAVLLCDMATIEQGTSMVSDAIMVGMSDDAQHVHAIESVKNHCPDVALNDLAYVIFTSGSSGKPKGVMVEHLGVVNTLMHCQSTFSVTAQSTLFQSTSLSFDAAAWVIFMALTSGATLRLATTQDLHSELQHYTDVTHIMMTPSILETLEASALPHIDTVIVGGEECKPEVVAPWLEESKSVFNAYGPTEASICSSIKPLCSSAAITIGQPNANMKYYVLDENQALVPRGGIGELYIAGPGVARGYLGQPELTSSVFTQDPYVTDLNGAPQRMYRTGDLVRIDENGDTRYLGRIDEQVKIRGYRIELQEIEAYINTFSGIESCIVRVVPNPSGAYLVAYVVCQLAQSDVEKSLQAFLASHLPRHMLPTHIVALQSLPLTSNGKVDIQALPVPQKKQSAAHFRAPETEVEKQVCDVIQSLLSINHIGMADNFFALGGTSLLAMKAVRVLNQTCQAAIKVEDLLNAADIQGIAQRVSDTAGSVIAAIKPAPIRDAYPLSTAQAGVFFEYELGRGAAYNVPLLMYFDGDFNLAIFVQALEALVINQPVLRTRFFCTEGEPRQQVLTTKAISVTRQQLPGSEQAEQVQFISDANTRITQVLQQPLDIYSGEMMHCHHFAHAEGLQIVLLNFSHIAVDGWSMDLIKAALKEYYTVLESGGAIPASKRDIEYIDYAYWQQRRTEDELSQPRQFWLHQLTLLNEARLLASGIGTSPRIESALVHFDIESSHQEAMRRLAAANVCSEFNVWIAVYAVATTLFTNSDVFTVNVDFANRNVPGTEGLVGMFVNSLLIVEELAGERDFSALLTQLRATCNATFRHGDFAFKEVLKDMQGVDASLLEAHLRHKFVYQSGSQAGDDNTVYETQEQENSIEFSGLKYDLSFVLSDSAKGMSGQIVYNQLVVEGRQVEKLQQCFSFVLAQVAEDPALCVSTLRQSWRQHVSRSFKAQLGGFKSKRKLTS
ncbi:hypothetical protein CWB99_07695 [Pseudoalteromonas rubra]|uniref:Carrier domain-containing protein n=1 Tax=Pseudoalteromonas rubra TaxID=43658 RepID=A0A5S3WNX9_9GAMM|nr:non-ribosomal peptide synthetase [Pseudoalteromonas rubra]TMP29963.1 hypothetical protein CWB99_07695 [Pseudoalteromonas rubra]TMP32191.1 hypothetical protein CWC00_13420 [Pseudoalteromonas rubra]